MTAFEALVALVALERLGELLLSRSHARALLARGQHLYEERGYAAMVLVHAAVLVFSVAEVRLAGRPFVPAVGYPALAAFAAATALRWWAIRTLGPQWTVRVVAGRGLRVVKGGPFRYVKHPNYLGVAVEVFALPLVHGAYATALLCGAANLAVVARRIRLEEQALRAYVAYDAAFAKVKMQR